MKQAALMAKEIYQSVKSDLLDLTIKDGDFLTLSNLAERYGVSKTPVRDALNELEKDGYLRALPRKGYLVVPLSQHDLKEHLQMRIILERAAACLAPSCASDAELAEIMRLAKSMPQSNTSFQEFNCFNTLFHLQILEAAHNSIVVDTGRSIMEKLSRVLLRDSMRINLLHEQREHEAIAQALLQRDGALANELIGKHIIELQHRIYNTNY